MLTGNFVELYYGLSIFNHYNAIYSNFPNLIQVFCFSIEICGSGSTRKMYYFVDQDDDVNIENYSLHIEALDFDYNRNRKIWLSYEFTERLCIKNIPHS